jgi:hypothetical protein
MYSANVNVSIGKNNGSVLPIKEVIVEIASESGVNICDVGVRSV